MEAIIIISLICCCLFLSSSSGVIAYFLIKPAPAPITTPISTPAPISTPVPITTPISTPIPITTPISTPVPITTPISTPAPITTPISTPALVNYCLSNDKNSDKFRATLNETTKTFSTVIDNTTYEGSYSINNNMISISAPNLLEKIKSSIPRLCSKPNTLPSFRCSNEECSIAEGKYNMGWCGQLGLKLSKGTC